MWSCIAGSDFASNWMRHNYFLLRLQSWWDFLWNAILLSARHRTLFINWVNIFQHSDSFWIHSFSHLSVVFVYLSRHSASIHTIKFNVTTTLLLLLLFTTTTLWDFRAVDKWVLSLQPSFADVLEPLSMHRHRNKTLPKVPEYISHQCGTNLLFASWQK